jgi:hypothetical protein
MNQINKIDISVNTDYYVLGKIQSGKTKFIIETIFKILCFGKIPIVILNNLTDDKTQLKNRIDEFIKMKIKIAIATKRNENMYKKFSFLISSQFNKEIIPTMYNNCFILLSNQTDIKKLRKIIRYTKQYQDLILIFDEADITNKNSSTALMKQINKIQYDCRIYVTATMLPTLYSNKLKILPKQLLSLGQSAEYKDLNMIEKIPIENTMNGIMSALFEISTDKKEFYDYNGNKIPKIVYVRDVYKNDLQDDEEEALMKYLSEDYIVNPITGKNKIKNKYWISIIYNGKGATIHFSEIFFKFFQNKVINMKETISKVLSFLRCNLTIFCDKENFDMHKIGIMIIANRRLQRGISVVDTKYCWHLCYQILLGKFSNCSNIIQSLRLLGNYKDNNSLTLYTTDENIKFINEYNKYQEFFVKTMINKNISNKNLNKRLILNNNTFNNKVIGKDIHGNNIKLKYYSIENNMFTLNEKRYEKYIKNRTSEQEYLEEIRNILIKWWNSNTIRSKILKYIFQQTDYKIKENELMDFLRDKVKNIQFQINMFVIKQKDEYKIYYRNNSTNEISLKQDSIDILKTLIH